MLLVQVLYTPRETLTGRIMQKITAGKIKFAESEHGMYPSNLINLNSAQGDSWLILHTCFIWTLKVHEESTVPSD